MRPRPVAVLLGLAFSLGMLSLTGGAPGIGAQAPTATPGANAAAPRPPLPSVRLDRINVFARIEGQVATTTIDFTFANATERPQEATLLFPVPAGAAISDFTMTVDGQTLEGELLGREEAARIYTGIVQRQRDPALLEYVGLDVLRARVFPVPPGGESRVSVRFGQLLGLENSALRYRLPLTSGPESSGPLAQLTIEARIENDRGVRSVFSPTHALTTERADERAVTVRHRGANVAARGVFELDALLAGDDVAAGLISYRVPGEDGFFMLWLSPPLREEAVVPKDVILVLDVSGSMAGVKHRQSQAAARFVLGALNPADRWQIVSFSSAVASLSIPLLPATEAGRGVAYVDGLRAEGGTNINDALLTAFTLARPERPTTLIFLTDGQPTVGEQNVNRILANVEAAIPPNVRLFAFGVGDDVNTVLLDSLATANRGDVQYVRPAEDVEVAVSTLYRRIGAPQLTDVRLRVEGVQVTDLYPTPMPDLFGGQTLFVLGRYRGGGQATVVLDGVTSEGPRQFRFEGMTLAADDRRASYLPYLWASRKVAALIREIRRQGPAASRELIDEVVALSRRYGIITEYTSFLVQEGPVSGAAAANAVADAARAPAAGSAATGAAAQVGGAAQAAPAPPPPAAPTSVAPRPAATAAPGGTAPPAAAEPARELRYIGDKAFLLRGGVWTDTSYVAGTPTTRIVFASDAYFALLAEKPDIAPYLALGDRLILVLDGMAYEITRE